MRISIQLAGIMSIDGFPLTFRKKVKKKNRGVLKFFTEPFQSLRLCLLGWDKVFLNKKNNRLNKYVRANFAFERNLPCGQYATALNMKVNVGFFSTQSAGLTGEAVKLLRLRFTV